MALQRKAITYTRN